MSKVERTDSPYKDRGFDYDLLITDSNGKQFAIFLGGNLDLYYMSKPYTISQKKRFTESYYIQEDGGLLCHSLDEFLNGAKKVDKYHECFDGDKFFWFSEDNPEEIANKLEITKDQNGFSIDFHLNLDTMSRSVRFTLSGSRNFEVAKALVNMRRNLLKSLAEIAEQDEKISNI